MDANNTRYHLLLTRNDWAACTDGDIPLGKYWHASPPGQTSASLAWDCERRELRLAPRLFEFTASSYDRKPQLQDRRGAGRDRFGNTYWIDETNRTILVNSAGSGRTTAFWSTSSAPSPEPTFGGFNLKEPTPSLAGAELSGLAVTEDHYLVAGVLAPAGLLIFDLHAGGAPQQMVFPPEVPFAPFDIAPAPGGGVWVLDCKHLCYWALDRYFNVIANEQESVVLQAEGLETFQPTDGGELRRGQRRFPLGMTFEDASPLDLDFPVAIEALPDGTVLILESPSADAPCFESPPAEAARFSAIYRFRYGERQGEPVSTETMLERVEPERRPDFRLLGHDFAFVPDRNEKNDPAILGTLFVVGEDGNQVFTFTLIERANGLELEALPDYYPMRLFGGKGLLASGQEVFYDFADRWLMLVEQRRPRYVTEGVLLTPLDEDSPRLDGREPGCVWHRLLIDGCIPPEADVTIWSRAADEIADLPHAAWQLEPRLYKRGDGSELPYVETEYETWELLLQRARGRYLQLRLRLRGDGRHSPNLRALRVYFPRFSYLQYLPAVYREERESAAFLERFLANIEGFFTTIEDKVAAVQMLFDVRSAPEEALDWLAGWFGVAFDAGWDAPRRRLFVKHAMTFFGRRGTIPGLLMALQLALVEHPDDAIFELEGGTAAKRANASGIRIIERFRIRKTPGVVLGDPTEGVGLRLVPQSERWLPAQGGAVLQQRYNEYLTASGSSPTLYTLYAPADPSLWTSFSMETLGFVPSGSPDANLWRDFLARRYRLITRLNDAYQRVGAERWDDFAAVPYPTTLPSDGPPLYDWFQFESIVLAMHATAHRFTVVLPVPACLARDAEAQQERVELARRIVELEKPVHTVFEVKSYWAMFRIGDVRLGYDTIIDEGSRAVDLLSPLILGQAHVMESYLAPSHPQNVQDRQILGRDQLTGDAI
ncbi:MAG TPA: phage tail protein [Chloroflexia bacterium]